MLFRVNEDDFASVNVFIGENGSGKTSLLNEINSYYVESEVNRIIINNGGSHSLGRGSRKTLNQNNIFTKNKRIIYDFIKRNSGIYFDKKTFDNKYARHNYYQGDDYSERFKFRDILFYLELSPVIYFKIPLEYLDDSKYLEMEFLGEAEFEFFYIVSREIKELISNISGNFFDGYLVAPLFFDDNFYESFSLISLLRYIKIFFGVEFDIFYSRGNSLLNIRELSSGEAVLISSMFHIASSLKYSKSNFLIIDEPELSLHPKWQCEYLKVINDMFYKELELTFVATHSPLILNSLFFDKYKKYEVGFNIYHVNNGRYKIIEDENEKTIEAIYWNIFGILTPQSHFLSRRLTELLNKIVNNEIDFNIFSIEIDKYIESSYDYKQIETLESLKKELSLKIENGSL